MKHLIFTIIFILLISISLTKLYAEEGNKGLRYYLNLLQEKKVELNQVRRDRVNEKVQHYNKMKKIEMEIYDLTDRTSAIRDENIGLEERIFQLNEELNSREEEVKNLRNKLEEVRSLLLEKTRELRNGIEFRPPFHRKERLKRANNIRERIRKEEKASLPELTGSLFDLFEREFESGREIALYTEEIPLGRETLSPCILKMGGVGGAYFSSSKFKVQSSKLKDEGSKLKAQSSRLKSPKSELRVGLLFKEVTRGDEVRYRWSEDIEQEVKDNLISLFKKLKEGIENPGEFPFDVLQGAKAMRTHKRGFVGWLTRGGPVMVPLGLVAIAIVLFTLERMITLFIGWRRPEYLLERLETLYDKEGIKGIGDAIRSSSHIVARMFKAALTVQGRNVEDVRSAIREVAAQESPKLDRFLSAIGMLATIAPLLGLLGTVSGMISTFHVLTVHGSGDPKMLSGGISEALITTEAGLIIAIPALLIYTYFSSRADRISKSMDRVANRIVEMLGKKLEVRS